MGGLHSGRKRQHTCINDCLNIDTTWLKKRKLLQPGKDQSFAIGWSTWKETNFKKRTNLEYQVSARLNFTGERPVLTLAYRAGHDEEHTQDHKHMIHLVSTPCNYGGQRWWFTAPCCQRRVRVLYLNTKTTISQIAPMCRDCQQLHYPSQLASYQERHATYERYLLSNFGYYWAMDEYYAMKEHYFKITPQWAYKAERAQLIRHLQVMKLVIRTERLIIRDRITTLKKLSMEGRRDFFEYLASDPKKAEDLQEYKHLANILIAKGIILPNSDQADPDAKLPDAAQQDTDLSEEVINLQLVKWMAEKEKTEQELKELDEAA